MTIWLLKIDSDINYCCEEIYSTKSKAEKRLNELIQKQYLNSELIMRLDNAVSYIYKESNHYIFITMQERVVE